MKPAPPQPSPKARLEWAGCHWSVKRGQVLTHKRGQGTGWPSTDKELCAGDRPREPTVPRSPMTAVPYADASARGLG